MDQQDGRTVKPNGSKVRASRSRKGWRVEDLCKHSGLSDSTIRRIERSVPTLFATLAAAADALGEPYAEFIEGGVVPQSTSATTKQVTQTITFAVERSEIDETEFILEQIRWIKERYGAGISIEVKSIVSSSIKVTFEIDEAVARQIEIDWALGQFHDTNITKITTAGEPFILTFDEKVNFAAFILRANGVNEESLMRFIPQAVQFSPHPWDLVFSTSSSAKKIKLTDPVQSDADYPFPKRFNDLNLVSAAVAKLLLAAVEEGRITRLDFDGFISSGTLGPSILKASEAVGLAADRLVYDPSKIQGHLTSLLA